MSQVSGTRSHPHGAVLLGVAGGMAVVAAGFLTGSFVLGWDHEARAATAVEPPRPAIEPRASGTGAPPGLAGYLARPVELVTAHGSVTRTWAELGAGIDTHEARRVHGELAALAVRGSLPLRIDRAGAEQALLAIKASHDVSPVNAFLDLEDRKIHDDRPGQALDVWASLPALEAAARQGVARLELVHVTVPAHVTRQTLGIDDISSVLGHFVTKFPVTDRDRNFNLKLAASKLNGVVLKPDEELSFNATVGERSEKEGYKIAHVITAGEMVDGLGGGHP